MKKNEIIPLTVAVQVKDDPKITRQVYRKIQREGFILPRLLGRSRLALSAIHEIANSPVGVTLEMYQRSQGKYGGRVMMAWERERAFAVRKQFRRYLEPITQQDGNGRTR